MQLLAPRSRRIAMATVGIIAVMFMPAQPSAAKPFDGVPSPDGSEVLLTAQVEGMEPFVYTESMRRADASAAVEAGAAFDAAPSLLDGVEVYQCNVRKNATYPITDYFAAYYSGFQGRVTLTCGKSSEYGWSHIKLRHEAQWKMRSGPYAWDDMMDYATKGALSHPSRIRQKASQKLCYTTPVVIVSGKKKTTFNPTVIISENNRRVVTSYPSTVSGC